MNEIININDLLNNHNKDSEDNPFIISKLLIKNSSCIIGAPEKVGKTTLVIQLMNSIVNKYKMLDLIPEDYHVDTIIFYSNDSTENSIKIKLDKMNVKVNEETKVYFIFSPNLTVEELFQKIRELRLSNERVLLVVDVLSGVRTSGNYNLNDYIAMSDTIDLVEENMRNITKYFGVIYLHHLTKNNNSLMGSRAIASRVSAVIIMSFDDSNDFGVLDVVGNDIVCRKIYIKRDKKHHIFVIDKKATESCDSDLDYQLLRINTALSMAKNHKIVGDVNKIVAETKVNILPRNLTRFLRKNKRYLNNNNIYFVIRKSGTTIVELYLKQK